MFCSEQNKLYKSKIMIRYTLQFPTIINIKYNIYFFLICNMIYQV